MSQPNNLEVSRSLSQDARFILIQEWLREQKYSNFTLQAASADASFRRYFRMMFAPVARQSNLIVMDAPPDKESLSPFIEIAQDWRAAGIATPEIHCFNRDLGILVLQDFGQQTLLQALDATNLILLYQQAIDELLQIQLHDAKHVLPDYSEQLFMQEMQLFVDWYLIKHNAYHLSTNQAKELESIFEILKSSASTQSFVNVHRDYHSRNLMYRSNMTPGVIDFQDAVRGPLSYDLVSLLKDCYIELSVKQREQLYSYYLQAAQSKGLLHNTELKSFQRAFDLMGVQRHLKAIGIFSRLYHRDGKESYLKDIPLTAGYILSLESTYPELTPLINILRPLVSRVNSSSAESVCEQ